MYVMEEESSNCKSMSVHDPNTHKPRYLSWTPRNRHTRRHATHDQRKKGPSKSVYAPFIMHALKVAGQIRNRLRFTAHRGVFPSGAIKNRSFQGDEKEQQLFIALPSWSGVATSLTHLRGIIGGWPSLNRTFGVSRVGVICLG
jgi:hypothetical protein